MIGSVLNEGAKGMQLSQREMQRSANEIARANVNENQQAQTPQASQQEVVAPVDEAKQTARPGNIAEPLIELRRQEQIFTASAKTVSIANDALGSIIDTSS